MWGYHLAWDTGKRNLFPREFVPRELFPEGIGSMRNKFTGYNFFRAREFVPHPGGVFAQLANAG